MIHITPEIEECLNYIEFLKSTNQEDKDFNIYFSELKKEINNV